MFEHNFATTPIRWKDWNVRLFNRDRSYLKPPQTEEGLNFEVRGGDGVVSGDDNWRTRRSRTRSYKDRCEIGRVEKGEGVYGTENVYNFRLKVPNQRPQNRWCILIQSHVRVDVNRSVYPYGWTFNIALGRVQDTLDFNYGVWSRPEMNFQTVTFPAKWGEWWDLGIHMHWSMYADGFAKVWLNGQPKFHMEGPNTPTQHPMEMKFGIYRGYYVRTIDRVVFASVHFK